MGVAFLGVRVGDRGRRRGGGFDLMVCIFFFYDFAFYIFCVCSVWIYLSLFKKILYI